MPQKLTLSEYAILVEQAPIMIWRAALSMECDYFNDVWLAFTGRTLAQESGNGWAEGVHADDLARCMAVYTEHFERHVVFEMEYRLRRHDGVYRWIFDRGTPYFDDSGAFLGYIGSCIDVTDRVEAQAALKEAKEREIDQLRGFIPICSYCKKIRNDRDYWEQIEAYISHHSRAQFTHGICPECQAKLMAEIKNLRTP